MNQPKPSSEQLYTSLAVIWGSMLMSQILFLPVIYMSRPEFFAFDFSAQALGDNAVIIATLFVFSLIAVTLSFVLKNNFLRRAEAAQSPALVQTGHILAWAFSEVPSLVAVLLAFAFSFRFFWIMIIFGVVTIIIHFPKRTSVHAASYR